MTAMLRYDPEVRVGDVLTFFYLLATICIFLGTRQALRVNIRVLGEMKAAREAQARALFESTFFQMLRAHRELVRGLVKSERHGVEVLMDMRMSLNNQLQSRPSEQPMSAAAAVDRVAMFFTNQDRYAGHYFRSLCHVMEHIDHHDEVGRSWYATLLRSQLTEAELVLLFHYGLIPPGQRIKSFVERYAMLQDIVNSELWNPDLRSEYSQSAFRTEQA